MNQSDIVLSLGGGALESESTRALLAESPGTCVIYLRAPLRVLIERCESQPGADVRPILRQRDTIEARFHSRLPHYERAHLTVDTNGLHPDRVIDAIHAQMLEASYLFPLRKKAMTT
jgi:shikimate kinase